MFDKINCFEMIAERLRDYSNGHIWSDGEEILCKTEDSANAIADMLECMYEAQGEEVVINTGYYDPEEDRITGKLDRYTGWWYVNID
jgi:hypothetical protein